MGSEMCIRDSRSIVADKPTLSAMAAAADVILLTVPQEAVVSSVNAVSSGAAPKVFIPRNQLTDGLCFIHHRHGRNAYNCELPDSCKMKHILKKKQQQRTGNGPGASSSRRQYYQSSHLFVNSSVPLPARHSFRG